MTQKLAYASTLACHHSHQQPICTTPQRHPFDLHLLYI